MRGSVDALQPPAWIGRNSPSISGCARTRDTGLSGKSAGERTSTNGDGATGAAKVVSLMMGSLRIGHVPGHNGAHGRRLDRLVARFTR